MPYSVVLLMAVGLLAAAWWVSVHQPATAAEAAVATALRRRPGGRGREGRGRQALGPANRVPDGRAGRADRGPAGGRGGPALCRHVGQAGEARPTKAPRGCRRSPAAVREGANAYLAAQFRKIGPLIILITIALFFTKYSSSRPQDTLFAFGRAGAFLVGSLFSWTVGFVGMRLATTGNLRVAAAAQRSYGEAMQLGYRTGTITGMLTDGLGLLGGTCIFLIYGEQAYEALLGFGFGGTLLALFMRVGGGIYTKAADVGADLVGKVEAGIPEDDPRNAATIADNVGDNVGDCAGMAADIFESYEVTIVAAMILGLASFGHKGVIFPLLVRGIGVLGSIISTYTVKAGAERHLRHGPEERPPRLLDRLADLDRRGSSPSASCYLYFPPRISRHYRWRRPASPDGTPPICPSGSTSASRTWTCGRP